MDGVGVLILFALVGVLICARARVAGGAIVFALLGLALFVATPAGEELPGAVADFVSAVGEATGPVLTDDDSADGGTEAVG